MKSTYFSPIHMKKNMGNIFFKNAFVQLISLLTVFSTEETVNATD